LGKKPRAWDDPFEFEGESAQYNHLSQWEENLSTEYAAAEAHEALSRLYTKTNKRKGGVRGPKRMRSWE
jgi:hypothetical protein